eukprot:m.1311386 g.1311386  ORF g.1311386 m.1311386 type:complete len:588 (-) comp24829_c1_seq27:2808-4571(-)
MIAALATDASGTFVVIASGISVAALILLCTKKSSKNRDDNGRSKMSGNSMADMETVAPIRADFMLSNPLRRETVGQHWNFRDPGSMEDPSSQESLPDTPMHARKLGYQNDPTSMESADSFLAYNPAFSAAGAGGGGTGDWRSHGGTRRRTEGGTTETPIGERAESTASSVLYGHMQHHDSENGQSPHHSYVNDAVILQQQTGNTNGFSLTNLPSERKRTARKEGETNGAPENPQSAPLLAASGVSSHKITARKRPQSSVQPTSVQPPVAAPLVIQSLPYYEYGEALPQKDKSSDFEAQYQCGTDVRTDNSNGSTESDLPALPVPPDEHILSRQDDVVIGDVESSAVSVEEAWLDELRVSRRSRRGNNAGAKSSGSGQRIMRMPSAHKRELEQSVVRAALTQLQHKNIQKGRVAGRGSFGTVFQGMLTDGKRAAPVAIKELLPGIGEKARLHFMQEADLLGQLDHPNICTLIGAILDVEPHCIVMELCETSLLNKVRQVEFDVLSKMAMVQASTLLCLTSCTGTLPRATCSWTRTIAAKSQTLAWRVLSRLTKIITRVRGERFRCGGAHQSVFISVATQLGVTCGPSP